MDVKREKEAERKSLPVKYDILQYFGAQIFRIYLYALIFYKLWVDGENFFQQVWLIYRL